MEFEKIAAFIDKHHLLSLATIGERLWCCSMFYAFDAEAVAFIVASEASTEHMRNVSENGSVAGTVALETAIVGKIQGIQFAGRIQKASDDEAYARYYAKFPYARVMNPTLWRIVLDEVKMTDNTLGFGKKLSWKRDVWG